MPDFQGEGLESQLLRLNSWSRKMPENHNLPLRSAPFLETLAQDFRTGWRVLRSVPLISLLAIAAIALGIGANTAIFSVIDAALLRPLPWTHPRQLVEVFEHEDAPGNYPFSGPDFLDFQRLNHSFQAMAAYFPWGSMSLTGAGHPIEVNDSRVSANFFSLLGVQAERGRTFLPGDDQPGRDHVAILSYGFWTSQFGRRPLVGRRIQLDGSSYRVIGILPPGFRFLVYSSARDEKIWLPLPIKTVKQRARGNHWLSVLGRLKPGVTVAEAQSDLETIAAQLRREYPKDNSQTGAAVASLRDFFVHNARPELLILWGAVALVLLIACVDVATLLLARAMARRHELALRSALGAGRGRLIRQLLTESLLLSLLGAGLGWLLAIWGVKLLSAAKPLAIPSLHPVELNATVFFFTLALALGAGMLFGLLPAWQFSTAGGYDELKAAAGRSVSPSRHHQLLSDGLIVAEVALSLVLLIGAGLLIRSFYRLEHTSAGVRPQNIVIAGIGLPKTSYSDAAAQAGFWRAFLRRAGNQPGMRSVALASQLPLQKGSNGYYYVPGAPPATHKMLVWETNISPGFFRTLGIPLLAGRDFNAADIEQGLKGIQIYEKLPKPITDREILQAFAHYTTAVVINQAMAQIYWPGKSALDQVFSQSPHGGPWYKVVGIAANTRTSLSNAALDKPAWPEIYQPAGGDSSYFVVALNARGAGAAIAGLRDALAGLNPDLPLYGISSMRRLFQAQTAPAEFRGWLLGAFAGFALLLAVAGIYGVLSYRVTRRQPEIGVRMALGASPENILRLIVKEGMTLIALGLALGLAGAWALTHTLASLLFGVGAFDPLSYAVAILALALAGFAASFVPARAAARVNPLASIRYE